MYLNEGFLLQHKKLVQSFMPSVVLNILILIGSYLIAYSMRKWWNYICRIKGELQ